MKRILVIDDLRLFEPLADEEIVHVRTMQEGRNFMVDVHWDEVWLDHDLGYDEDLNEVDVRPLVSHIEEAAHLGHLYDVGMFVILTSNPVGRDWMIAALSPYYTVEIGKREYTIEWPS